MSVRHTPVLLGAIFAGFVLMSAAPAQAALPSGAASSTSSVRSLAPGPGDDRSGVALRDLPGSFQVGQPAPLSIAVTKRRIGCLTLRRTLTVRLNGLRADRLRATRVYDDHVSAVPVAVLNDGGLRVVDSAERLCGRGVSVAHYRLEFRAGTPAGRAGLVAQAATVAFNLQIGRATAIRDVTAARPPAPNPAPKPPAHMAPAVPRKPPAAQVTPTPTPTVPPPTEDVAQEPAVPADEPSAAAAVPAGDADDDRGGPWLAVGQLRVGQLATLFGGALLVAGAGVLFFLLRGFRRRSDQADEQGEGGEPEPTLVVPTLPG